MGREAVVQAAIVASMEVYADRHNVQTSLHTAYANQQGSQLNKLPGDIVGHLARSILVLLEVKELDQSTGVAKLPAYDIIQHVDNIDLEINLKLPILYAYADPDEMPYLDVCRNAQWPNATLFRTRISAPSRLLPIGQAGLNTPDIEKHGTLLEWLMFPPSTAGSALLSALLVKDLGIDSLKTRIAIVISNTGSLLTIPAPALQRILDDTVGDFNWVDELDASDFPLTDEERAQLKKAKSHIQERIKREQEQKKSQEDIRQQHGADKKAANGAIRDLNIKNRDQAKEKLREIDGKRQVEADRKIKDVPRAENQEAATDADHAGIRDHRDTFQP